MTMRTTPFLRSFFFVSLVLASCLVLNVVAAAQPIEEPSKAAQAKRDFKEGVELFLAKRYSEAQIKFKKSYEARPKPIVLFNIAMCHKALFEFAESYACFERFLETADETDRAVPVAKDALSELDTLVGLIEIEPDTPEDASVELDGDIVGNTPLPKTLRVNPGRHAIKVTSLDKGVFEESIEVASGKTETVRPRFPKKTRELFEPAFVEETPKTTLDDAPTSQESAGPVDTSLGKKRIAALIAGGAGLVAAGVSGYFGYQRQFVDLPAGKKEAAKGTVEGDQNTLDEINDRGRRHAILAAVCGGAAATLVGTAIALWVVGKREEATERRVQVTASGVTVTF